MSVGRVAPWPGAGRPVLRALATVLLLALVVFLVRSLVVRSFVIPSASMAPTLQVGDRILVLPLAYRIGAVRRGDVVVFDGEGVFDPRLPASSGGTALAEGVLRALGVSTSGRRTYVKRVVGLPGDHVACCDGDGRVTVGGHTLVETYIAPGARPSDIPFDVTVPAGRVWVMGDNRGASADSRAHLGDPGGGTVPLDRIVGRAVVVYWPSDRAGRLDTEDREENP